VAEAAQQLPVGESPTFSSGVAVAGAHLDVGRAAEVLYDVISGDDRHLAEHVTTHGTPGGWGGVLGGIAAAGGSVLRSVQGAAGSASGRGHLECSTSWDSLPTARKVG
jgi:hypothetical protein